jgi:DNA-directed RNA polymerase specialized sigma24 family protein
MTDYNPVMPRTSADLEKAILDYRNIVSFRVRKALGSQTPDWEDVVNEIMAQVLEKVRRREFRGESSIGTFIYIVTSRRIVE